ncbi:LacI family DNA-binding transcriptional regulator [Hoeflea sp. CAU 1731]
MGKTKLEFVRSRDVAQLAGVSRSAVSRTYTPGAYVSDATRKKVLAAAEMLGYAPNAMARSLKTKRTGIIGIVSSDLHNPFQAELLERLTTALQNEGFAPLLLFADDADSDQQLEQMISYQVEALAVTSATVSSRMAARFLGSNKPIVAINRFLAQGEITSITSDNAGSAAKIVDHLVEIGCRKIAFVSGDPIASSSQEREDGFLRRMAHYNLVPFSITGGNYTYEGGVEAGRRILEGDAIPDAIACANDLMSFGVIDIGRDAFGIDVPKDVKVTGFDNSLIADWQSYALTSIDPDVERMVQLGLKNIMSGITGQPQSPPSHLKVPGQLVVRASTIR